MIMSNNLKNDILKVVADSKNLTQEPSKISNNTPIFKDPQMLQHSLNTSLHPPQKLSENFDNENNND